MASATVAEEEYLQTSSGCRRQAAHDGSQRRARDAALGPDRPRDGRPPRARRLHHARADKPSDSPTAGGSTRRRSFAATASSSGSSPTSWASRGTRCTRRPSGSSTRCRRSSRSGCSPRSATRAPAPTATRSTPARGSTACRSPTSRSARRSRVLRFENEAEELLHYLKTTGLEPGPEGRGHLADDGEVVVTSDAGQRADRRASRRDGLGARRPVAAAARRAARAARHLQGTLRPLAARLARRQEREMGAEQGEQRRVR